LQMAFCAYYKI